MPITQAEMSDAFAAIESNNLRVSNIIVSSQALRDLQSFGRMHYDAVSAREIIASGNMGSLWGARLHVTNSQSANREIDDASNGYFDESNSTTFVLEESPVRLRPVVNPRMVEYRASRRGITVLGPDPSPPPPRLREWFLHDVLYGYRWDYL